MDISNNLDLVALLAIKEAYKKANRSALQIWNKMQEGSPVKDYLNAFVPTMISQTLILDDVIAKVKAQQKETV